MTNHEISAEIISNFHLFWDNFPFPVLLVHKDRTILAQNKAGDTVGYTPGTKCIDMGKKEHHKACLANQALREQTAKRLVDYFEFAGAVLDSYWVPLAGRDDIYVHFAADITEYTADCLKNRDNGEKDGRSCSCG